jgi:hypothetical protein
MPSVKHGVDQSSVFLNVPFDPPFRPLFLALVVGLSALGFKPRSVLEVPAYTNDRLRRIYQLISSCGASVHDLSRVEVSGPDQLPRFNMPFELGLAVALFQMRRHRFFVFEAQRFRLQRTLSDLNGYDPFIHEATARGVLHCLVDCFSEPTRAPNLSDLLDLHDTLSRVVGELETEHGVDTPFSPSLFRQTVDAAADLAQGAGLIN